VIVRRTSSFLVSGTSISTDSIFDFSSFLIVADGFVWIMGYAMMVEWTLRGATRLEPGAGFHFFSSTILAFACGHRVSCEVADRISPVEEEHHQYSCCTTYRNEVGALLPSWRRLLLCVYGTTERSEYAEGFSFVLDRHPYTGAHPCVYFPFGFVLLF
jgi:hypothetical protein